MKIGLFGYNLGIEKAKIFKQLAKILDRNEIEYIYGPCFDLAVQTTDINVRPVDDFKYMQSVDYVIAMGGDGTILKAVAAIGAAQTPILGINLGRLGFLASLEEDRLEEAVRALKGNHFKIKNRRMVFVESNKPLFGDAPFALNDFTIQKRDTSAMITIHAFLNGEYLTSYWADGLIVSTPTGSTGYSLSCGGPIVFPNSGNFVITPIAPHNLNVRPIVISDNSVISFEIEGRSDSFLCSADSRFELIDAEHQLAIRRCDFDARLLHLTDFSYLENIRRKMTWGQDKRN